MRAMLTRRIQLWWRGVMWLLVVGAGVAVAETPVQVDERTASMDLIPYTAYLKDPAHTATIESVLTEPWRERFQAAAWRTAPNFGFTAATHWFRYRVASRAATPLTWYVKVNRPRLDRIGYYVVTDGRIVRRVEVGNALPGAPRDVPVRPFVFALTLEPGQEVEVHMAFRSEAALWIPLTLWSPASFWSSMLREEQWNLLFFGYMLALTIVATFMAVVVRDKAYVFYTLTTITFVCFLFCFMQYPAFFEPRFTFWGNKCILLAMGLSGPSFLYYTRYFLGLSEQAPRMDRFLCWTAGVIVVIHLAVLPLSYAVASPLISCGVQICIVAGFTVSAIHALRGHRTAILYMAGWSVFLLVVMVRYGAVFGWLSSYWTNDFFAQWSAMFGYTLFLLALGDRIQKMERDKFAAQARVLAIQKHMTRELERQVRERTENLHEAKEAAERAREAMSRFLINVVHDIRAPLNAVFGLAQALWLESEKLKLPDRYCRFLIRVREGGEALSHMLANLFDLSRIEMGQVPLRQESFSVDEWVAQMRQILGLVAEHKGVSLCWQVAGGDRVLHTDRVRLSQILLNLAHNAIKFTPVGARVEIGLDAQVERFILSVDDAGPGIAEERRAMLWDRDALLGDERRGEGLGLGLFIVKTNAELLGGTVGLEPSPSGGARFVFRLPLISS